MGSVKQISGAELQLLKRLGSDKPLRWGKRSRFARKRSKAGKVDCRSHHRGVTCSSCGGK